MRKFALIWLLTLVAGMARSGTAVLNVTAQPLASEEVLEPSVQNEVEHALNLAVTNEVAVSPESLAFAALYATNRMSATRRAIDLVSSQKDGRWLRSGRDVTPVAARLLRKMLGRSEPRPKVSIFALHIEELACQRGISFAEAVRQVRELGFRGADVMEGMSSEKIAELKRQGFEIPCVIGFTKFELGYDEAQCARLMDLARRCGSRLIMLVPGFYPDGADRAMALKAILERTNRFAAEAARQGFETVVEDFDNERSPTFGLGRLSAFLQAAPSVGFVYDTGNFNDRDGRPEDGLKLLARVRHFHLKDRPADGGDVSVAVGSGRVPIVRLVSAARDAGYGGWFTVEHFGVTNMLENASKSARYLLRQEL